MQRIAQHRMHRIVQRSSKFQRKRSASAEVAAMVRKKQLMLGDALAKSGRQQLRFVEVEITDGFVVLQGRVKSFFMKQLAQESVRPVATGMRIINRIAVQD